MIYTVKLHGFPEQTISPKYNFHSSAAKEVAERLGITKDCACDVTDEDGHVENFIVCSRQIIYVRPR